MVAGTATPLQFQYENAATFTPKYAANSTTTATIADHLKVT